MPDEDSSQPPPPIEDASQPAPPVEDTPQPISPSIPSTEVPVTETSDTPSESVPTAPDDSDAPVAETPVTEPSIEPPVDAPVEAPTEAPIEAEPPAEAPIETPIAEPTPTPIESTSVPTISPPVVPISNAAPSPAPAPDHSSSAYLKSLVPLSLAERNRRRQAHLEKLMADAAKKGITSRREVQLLLEVSGATADRYLRELASKGRLVKENNARYTKYRFVR